jgi:hypothetical protein
VQPVRSTGRARSSTRATSRRKRGLRDRSEPGRQGSQRSKYYLLTDGSGLPLAWTLTGANRNEGTQLLLLLLLLLEAIPPVRAGRAGRSDDHNA